MSFDEAQLVADAQRGDRDAFAKLYDVTVQPIYQFLYYKTFSKETAEDLTSTVFLKALERLDAFAYRGEGSFKAWLYVVARNAFADHLRKAKHSTRLDDDIDVPETQPSAKRTEAAADLALALKELHALPDVQRDIVIMRVWQDMPYKDIAVVVGKNEANCKVIFSRAVKALRERLPLAILILLLLHV